MKQAKLLAVLLIALIMLTGCARTVWNKAGASPQDFNRESYECERDARQSGYFGGGVVGGLNMQSFYERCMVAKGWLKSTEPLGATSAATSVTISSTPIAPITTSSSPIALITMDRGDQIALELWPDVALNHVKNFADLANRGFYDGQRVHRVEPKFVVQFGDPNSKTLPMNDPKIGTGGSGQKIKAEFNKRPFDRGVLGMARTNDPDSASSQVYIMLGDSHFLNGQYTAFGKVVKGMEVVDQIKVGDRIALIRVR